MKLADLPIVATVLEFGAEDPIFNTLLLIGPMVLALIVLFERSVITVLLAGVYVALLVLYVIYQGVTSETDGEFVG